MLVAVSLTGCATLGLKTNYTQSRYVQPISDNSAERDLLDASRPSVIYLYDTTASGYQDMHRALNLSCRQAVMRSVPLNCYSGNLEDAGEIAYSFGVSQHTALIGLPPLKGLTEEQLELVGPMVRDGVFTREMLDEFIADLRSGIGVRRAHYPEVLAGLPSAFSKTVVIQARELNWERSGDTHDVSEFWKAARRLPQFNFVEMDHFDVRTLPLFAPGGSELKVDPAFRVAYIVGTLEAYTNDKGLQLFKLTNVRVFYSSDELNWLDKPRSE